MLWCGLLQIFQGRGSTTSGATVKIVALLLKAWHRDGMAKGTSSITLLFGVCDEHTEGNEALPANATQPNPNPPRHLSMSCCFRFQRGFKSCPFSKVKPCTVVISRSLQLLSGDFTACRNSTPPLEGRQRTSARQSHQLHRPTNTLLP